MTINITDTLLTGNRANSIVSCHSVSFSNVTIANSQDTGLTLIQSTVMVNNSLSFRNNTGDFGGGLSLSQLSYFMVLPQASFEFVNNSASYKGGGFFCSVSSAHPFVYAELSDLTFAIPLTLWNNTAGKAGADIYGFVLSGFKFYGLFVSFSLINPRVSSSTNAIRISFCDFNDAQGITLSNSVPEQHIFPGQKLKFKVALFGFDGNETTFSLTDGVVDVFIDTIKVFNYSFAEANCSIIEYTPTELIYSRHEVVLSIFLADSLILSLYSVINEIVSHYIIHECPAGFSINSSQGICTCSQSVSRENVTCDIVSLNITHNGLLWIGTYDTSTPFNANATNPNACIINEDCLLYCSPSPVAFMLNDTDTQCVDNRGQRMCGSCRDGYSLLMGSNKCGQCNDDYMMIAWIALFAVMGVLLVVLLIALNLTVSVGTLNGLLFYANIVKLYEPVFSRKGALPVLSQVISWINLDFGFEICFYNGINSYAKQWLQFAFPLY
uniref:Uncharacterized protein n=1 Tax=Amphimedon queenslandica TaxID=400682 RepID=A0A1X7U3W7_AMPQE